MGIGDGDLHKHIANIRTSGAILPSSPFLVARLLRGIDFGAALNIVELGVGTGCVTRAILRRMRADARLVSVEVNRTFIDACQDLDDARLSLRHGCAVSLPEILQEEGMERVDVVISSLPLAIMDQDVVERVMELTRASLRPEGKFVQYQYSLGYRQGLSRRYGHVDVGFTLLNVPPAFVFECSPSAAPVERSSKRVSPLPLLYAGGIAAVAMIVRALQDN